MTVLWHCSCGAELVDAHVAFLHRDGTAQHHVTPMLLDREDGYPIPAGMLLFFLNSGNVVATKGGQA